MVSLSADTLYQALSERALLDTKSCQALLTVANAFLEKLKRECRTTVTQILVGFARSENGVMLHFVVLTTHIEIRFDDPVLADKNREHDAVYKAMTQANLELKAYPHLGVMSYMVAERELASQEEMQNLLTKIAGFEGADVKFVCTFDNQS